MMTTAPTPPSSACDKQMRQAEVGSARGRAPRIDRAAEPCSPRRATASTTTTGARISRPRPPPTSTSATHAVSAAPYAVMMNAPRASQLFHCGRTRIVQKRSGRFKSPTKSAPVAPRNTQRDERGNELHHATARAEVDELPHAGENAQPGGDAFRPDVRRHRPPPRALSRHVVRDARGNRRQARRFRAGGGATSRSSCAPRSAHMYVASWRAASGSSVASCAPM